MNPQRETRILTADGYQSCPLMQQISRQNGIQIAEINTLINKIAEQLSSILIEQDYEKNGETNAARIEKRLEQALAQIEHLIKIYYFLKSIR